MMNTWAPSLTKSFSVANPQCQRGSHGCGRGNADCDSQPRRKQKQTESGLSERQFEFKPLTIIVSRNPNRTSPKNSGLRADWEGKTRFR